MESIGQLALVHLGMVTSGRGAGARPGNWKLSIVESSDIREDGWLELEGLEESISVARSIHTERHQLRPYDVLVTARASEIKVALVPPSVSDTVAGSTLLLVRPYDPGSGMGHYLWYFLTSSYGNQRLAGKVRTHRTMKSLSAGDVSSILLPGPASVEGLDRIKRLVEASEEAFEMARKAADLRRKTLRDSVIREVTAKDGF